MQACAAQHACKAGPASCHACPRICGSAAAFICAFVLSFFSWAKKKENHLKQHFASFCAGLSVAAAEIVVLLNPAVCRYEGTGLKIKKNRLLCSVYHVETLCGDLMLSSGWNLHH